jgi:hypothetical protein
MIPCRVALALFTYRVADARMEVRGKAWVRHGGVARAMLFAAACIRVNTAWRALLRALILAPEDYRRALAMSARASGSAGMRPTVSSCAAFLARTYTSAALTRLVAEASAE